MAEHIIELSDEEVEAVSGGFIAFSFNDFNKTSQKNVAIQPVYQSQTNKFFAYGGDQVAVPVAVQTNYNETNQ